MLAFPGVQADVMVVSPRAQECGGVSHPLHDLESECMCVEDNRPFEIRHFQVHVPDLGAGIERLGHASMIAHVRGSRQAAVVAVSRAVNVLQEPMREHHMAEVLVEYSDPVTSKEGRTFIARACGGELDDSRWQGWIEFEPVDGGPPIRSARETTQPNRTDTVYWATGLTPVYLEGSLDRALNPFRLMLLEPLGVTAQLLLDPVRRAIERQRRFRSAVRCLQHDPIGDRRDNIAGEMVVRSASERHIGADRPGEMLFGNLRHSAGGMLAQGFTCVYLMA